MISIGAASEPARSSSASSVDASADPMPVIWKRAPSSSRMVATVSTSPLFFSNSTMAISLPILLRVPSRIRRPPSPFRSTPTAGCWFWSKLAVALEM